MGPAESDFKQLRDESINLQNVRNLSNKEHYFIIFSFKKEIYLKYFTDCQNDNQKWEILHMMKYNIRDMKIMPFWCPEN